MNFDLAIATQANTLRADVICVDGGSMLSFGAVLRTLECLQEVQPELLLNVRHIHHTMDTLQAPKQRDAVISLSDYLADLDSGHRPDVVFLVCGLDVNVELRHDLVRLARACVRRSLPLAGFGAANWVFAEAGILDGKKCVAHWQSDRAFAERNLTIDVDALLFRAEGKIATCAGDAAAIDFMLALFAHNFGTRVAKELCDRLLISYPRDGGTRQPGAPDSRLQFLPHRVQSIVRDMYAHIEEPLELETLARKHKISQRHMERLFAETLGTSPRNYYRDLQTERAFQLCQQTEMPLAEIAIACGFTAPGTLSKSFLRRYGMTPAQFRKRQLNYAQQNQTP